MVPICLVGALLSDDHFVFRAASFAWDNKQSEVFVDPLTPGVALITLPFTSTSILTTTNLLHYKYN